MINVYTNLQIWVPICSHKLGTYLWPFGHSAPLCVLKRMTLRSWLEGHPRSNVTTHFNSQHVCSYLFPIQYGHQSLTIWPQRTLVAGYGWLDSYVAHSHTSYGCYRFLTVHTVSRRQTDTFSMAIAKRMKIHSLAKNCCEFWSPWACKNMWVAHINAHINANNFQFIWQVNAIEFA